MGCDKIKLGTAIMILCSRGRRVAKCQVCRERPHTRLCDYPVTEFQTCDKRLCDNCTTKPAPEKDHCPEHK